MARKRTQPLQWFPLKRKIGEYDLEGEYAIDGRLIRVRSKHHVGEKVTQLGGSKSDPESLAAMLLLELAKG